MSKQTKEQNTQQRRDTVKALKATNHHRRICAEYLGISKQALGARIRKFNIKSIPYSWAKLPTKTIRKVRHDLVVIDMEEARSLYISGMTYEKLGLHFNCHASSVRIKLVKYLSKDKYQEMIEKQQDNRNQGKYHVSTRNRPEIRKEVFNVNEWLYRHSK